MKSEGLFFSAEALFALLLLCLLLFSLNSAQQQTVKLTELYQLQKADDLLKVWGLERNFSQNELVSDARIVFPNQCVIVFLDSKALNDCAKTQNFFAVSGDFLNESLNSFKIKLVVYY